jgi:hypothetical protein
MLTGCMMQGKKNITFRLYAGAMFEVPHKLQKGAHRLQGNISK